MVPFALMKELVGRQMQDSVYSKIEEMDGTEFLDSIGI
jgi:hypothetical protein